MRKRQSGVNILSITRKSKGKKKKKEEKTHVGVHFVKETRRD